MMGFNSLVKKDTKIKNAIQLMGSSSNNKYIAGIAVVVDDESHVLGVLTDGDIRRGLSKGIGIGAEVQAFANFSPVTVQYDYPKNQMLREIITQAKSRKSDYHKFDKIILVDKENKFKDVVLLLELLHEHINYKVIAIYGMGFVGLTLASVLASVGLIVSGIDSDPTIIKTLEKGKPHFFENGLESLLASVKEINPINFTTDYGKINADIHIVCVGTPIDENKRPVLKYIRQVTETISQKLKRNDLVIYRSTVPVGTTRTIILPILEKSGLIAGKDFFVSFTPERTVEGNALEELRTLPQVIGGYDQTSVDLTTKLFGEITKTIVTVDSLEAAEMIKLINNTYRDLVFSFANEVSYVCEDLNINTFKLIEVANEGYPRNPVPMPSPGVGGVCLSKDPYLFINPVQATEYTPILGKNSRIINSNGPSYVFEKVKKFCGITNKDLNKIKIFLIGIAFKGMPETSDIRGSISMRLIETLPVKENIYIKDFVVQKDVIENTGCNFIDNIMEGFENTDVVLIMNNHYQNKRFNVAEAFHLINKPSLFFDGWNMFNQAEIERHEKVFYATMGYMTER